MRKLLGVLVMVAALWAAGGCATASRQAASQGKYPTAEIATLERAIADAQGSAELPRLLLDRGHAYLLEGETWLKAHPDVEERRQGFERYAGHFLRAITDFETIVTAYPDRPEAAEAMFHLGVVHDSPNLANLQLAIGYYRRTLEQFPGSEWAWSAQRALDDIRERFHRLYQKSLGI